MWAQILNAALGIWLMAAPGVLDYGNPAEDNDHIVGPVAATFAIVAIWEATRALRWVNLGLGFWLLLAPWVLGYHQTIPTINDMAVGFFLVVFALVKGRITKRYGGGWLALWKSSGPADRNA